MIMSLKGLPIIKCVKCGRTTLKDEYELSGCPSCHSTVDGVEFGKYRRRESLIALGEGVHVFTAKFKKVGNLHYNNRRYYAFVEDVKCGGESCVTNHTYIDNISPNTIEQLKLMKPGTRIEFKAHVNQYNKKDNKWGMSRMHHLMSVVKPERKQLDQ